MNDAPRVVVIGGGPAGLMAAETILDAGFAVDLYDAMPSVGRKFLLAGIGGMNITHSEADAEFLKRYRERSAELAPILQKFGSAQLQAWMHTLGVESFVGSSGRVFPAEMKAAPLLRKWLGRLRGNGLRIFTRHRWLGWTDDGSLEFSASEGEVRVKPRALVLALGGASWPRLGSDGAWAIILRERAVTITELKAANCGFECDWSEFFRDRFAGEPLKVIRAGLSPENMQRGEMIITREGVEGGLVYALSADIRTVIERDGHAMLYLDLLPDFDSTKIRERLAATRGTRSVSEHLRRQLGLKGLKVALLHEVIDKAHFDDMALLAKTLKCFPLRLLCARPLDEAISTAGGVRFDAMNQHLMLHAMPGVFCAGEMLDWEAPTGGYLLTACFATGRAAGEGVVEYLEAGGDQ